MKLNFGAHTWRWSNMARQFTIHRAVGAGISGEPRVAWMARMAWMDGEDLVLLKRVGFPRTDEYTCFARTNSRQETETIEWHAKTIEWENGKQKTCISINCQLIN